MDVEAIEAMSVPELVALYNEKADRPVKSFRDRKAAVRRVKKLLGIPARRTRVAKPFPESLIMAGRAYQAAVNLGMSASLEEFEASYRSFRKRKPKKENNLEWLRDQYRKVSGGKEIDGDAS